jgi:FixJ family two-component response regulator
VYERIARRQDESSIARDLGLAPRTIREVRARVLRKMKLRSTENLLQSSIRATPRG